VISFGEFVVRNSCRGLLSQPFLFYVYHVPVLSVILANDENNINNTLIVFGFRAASAKIMSIF
jgi:hypothetical protein